MEHYPVLLNECVEQLGIRPDGIYIDATAGLGNHSGAIAALLETGRLYSCDRDNESLAKTRANTAAWADRIEYVNCRFSELRSQMQARGVEKANGLLADLGVSRYQLTDASRGFSLLNDGDLDMRMSREDGPTAADIVNFTAEKQLADLLYNEAEERGSRRIANALVKARPIYTTGKLAKVVESAVPRTGKIHPATKTFMALRRVVNEETAELEALLEAVPELVAPDGRAAIISFMSLEDRLVKHKFQALAREGRAVLLNKHVIVPTEEEIAKNPASRSGKLRALRMVR